MKYEEWFEENVEHLINAFMDANGREPTEKELQEYAKKVWELKQEEGKKKEKDWKITCTIETAKIREFLRATYILCDEVKISIKNEGWKINTVDPAHVGLVNFTLPAEEFTEYENDDEVEIAIDIHKIYKYISHFGEGLTKIFITPAGITIKCEGISRNFALLDVEEYKDVKVPELSLNAKITLDRETIQKFYKALKIADTFAQYIKLQAEKTGMFTVFTDEDNENMQAEIGSIAEIEGEEEKVVSRYPLDYLSDMTDRIIAIMNTFMKESVVIEFAKDRPIKISCGDVYYMLAPSIYYEG